MPFLEQLAKLQESANMTDLALDQAIGKTKGNYIGRIKRKLVSLPDPDTIHQIGEVLGKHGAPTSGDALLKIAIPEIVPVKVQEFYRLEKEKQRQDFEKLLSDTESLIADSGLRAASIAQTLRTIKSIQDRSDRREADLRNIHPKTRSSTSDVADVLNRYLHLVLAVAEDDFKDWLIEHPGATEQEQQRILDRLVCELVHRLHVIPADLPHAWGAHLQRAHAYANVGLEKAWWKEHAEQMGREEELIDELRSVKYSADYDLDELPPKPTRKGRKTKEPTDASE